MLREAFILKTTYFLSDKKWWFNFLHGECESSYLQSIIFHLNLTAATGHQEKRDVPVREALSEDKHNNAFLRASLTGEVQGRELSSSVHVISGVYIVNILLQYWGCLFLHSSDTVCIVDGKVHISFSFESIVSDTRIHDIDCIMSSTL